MLVTIVRLKAREDCDVDGIYSYVLLLWLIQEVGKRSLDTLWRSEKSQMGEVNMPGLPSPMSFASFA